MARDLVCLLEIQSRPQDVAELTKLMENFFISGAARIDLIAKVLDLDNDMGGLNFDIPLLEEMEDALTSLSEPTGITGSFSLGGSSSMQIHILEKRVWAAGKGRGICIGTGICAGTDTGHGDRYRHRDRERDRHRDKNRYIRRRMRRHRHRHDILVPRAYDPSGLRQESRALGATIMKEQRK